jgi:hypothetical protein
MNEKHSNYLDHIMTSLPSPSSKNIDLSSERCVEKAKEISFQQ